MVINEQQKSYLIRQLKSFVKTYVTIFLTLYLYQITSGVEEGQAVNLLNWDVIGVAATWGFIGVLRSLYKLITEPIAEEKL